MRRMQLLDERRKAMQAFVDARKKRSEFFDPVGYVRWLCRGTQIEEAREGVKPGAII